MQTFMQKILSFGIQLLSSYLKEASKISLQVLQILLGHFLNQLVYY